LDGNKIDIKSGFVEIFNNIRTTYEIFYLISIIPTLEALSTTAKIGI